MRRACCGCDAEKPAFRRRCWLKHVYELMTIVRCWCELKANDISNLLRTTHASNALDTFVYISLVPLPGHRSFYCVVGVSPILSPRCPAILNYFLSGITIESRYVRWVSEPCEYIAEDTFDYTPSRWYKVSRNSPVGALILPTWLTL